MMKICVVFALFCTLIANCDEAADLKTNLAKKEEALSILNITITHTTSQFVRDFGGRLVEGVVDLAEHTSSELSKTSDPTQRHAVIDYSTKAYERLIKFIIEISETIP